MNCQNFVYTVTIPDIKQRSGQKYKIWKREEFADQPMKIDDFVFAIYFKESENVVSAFNCYSENISYSID